jgi:hypothetical protein
MTKLYIFGIGGTGARVLKAFTMLLAAGCKLNNGFSTVVPILIDPDTANGDLNRTKEILKLYQQIRNQVYQPDDFFEQELKTVQELADNTSTVDPDYFQFKLSNVDQNTFQQYIGFQGLSNNFNNGTDDKNFMRSLFSDANLGSNLNVGFKGNPNMGSIVLNQFTNSSNFDTFIKTFVPGDGIFIINSIFGGTGAAGFPLLLKTLRSLDGAISSAQIGGLTFLPYFNLNKQDEVSSDTFMEKARIALEYYNRTIISQNQINSLYLLGDNNNQIIDYADGGLAQQNDAHFLELAGALSVFDFISNIHNHGNVTLVKEFGVRNDNNHLGFSDLDLQQQQLIERPLVKYKLFYEYLNKGLKKAIICSRWTKSNMKLVRNGKQSPLDEGYFKSPSFNNEIIAFNKHFEDWLNEMDRNTTVSFSPFNILSSENAMKVNKNRLPKGSVSFKKIDIENSLGVEELDIMNNHEKVHTSLIKLFSRSIEKAGVQSKIF